MSANDSLQRASWDRIEFPYTKRTAKLVSRHSVHEFSRMAGGAIEKQGRGVWKFSFDVPFHATIEGFPNLYPAALDAFTRKAEALYTAPLVVPGIGETRAFLTELDRTRIGKIRSGEDVTLSFIEDDLEPFRKAAVPVTKATLEAAGDELFLVYDGLPLPGTSQAARSAFEKEAGKIDLFSALNQALNLVNGIKDQAELMGRLFAAKLEKVSSLCRQIHDTAKFLQHPEFHGVARGVRNVWNAANEMRKDLFQRGPRLLVPFTVPARMAVSAIAMTVYGDGRRGGEILSLNDVADPFSVPAGTVIRIYQDARDGR
jgi:hypothetical protein